VNVAEKVDYSLIPVINVARQLLGDEGRERGTAEEKHFPNHGGLFVNIKKNRWYSHGNTKGGDAIALIQFANGCDHRAAFDWLRANGYESYLGERPAPKEIVATYDYEDENGDVLFQAVRFNPKDFRQRRRVNGEWAWKLGDTRRVLYRLPELMEAVALERPIFIVEGEKSVEALTKLGVTSTCSPMGAGKWRDEYSSHLKGADVVILPDNDKVGEAHANDVAQSLNGVAARVRVLRLAGLPDGGDVYDWLESGGTAEHLFEAAEIADEWGKPEEKLTGWRSHVSFSSVVHRAKGKPTPTDIYINPRFPDLQSPEDYCGSRARTATYGPNDERTSDYCERNEGDMLPSQYQRLRRIEPEPDFKAELKSLLNDLPDIEAKVITLRRYGLKLREVAEDLGVSTTTAWRLEQSAMEKITWNWSQSKSQETHVAV
jgi:Sigma-70, region 4